MRTKAADKKIMIFLLEKFVLFLLWNLKNNLL